MDFSTFLKCVAICVAGFLNSSFCEVCPPGTFGRYCECLGNDEPVSCLNANSTLICSGRGVCVCGVCQCFPRADERQFVYGRYCECDNFECPELNGLLCGGPEHGACDCGVCLCRPGWLGNNCGMPSPSSPIT